jgi:deoxyhypusine synthase
MYKILLSGELEQYYEIDPKNSWMLAAAEKNLPIVVPGWEDSPWVTYLHRTLLKAK